LSLLFIDTSALAKRYLVEAGAPWVGHLTHPAAGNVIIISDVTTVEMSSLLARRVREGTLPQASATLLLNAFLQHAAREYLSVPLDSHVLAQARSLVGKHPLRTLDAIQLASALRASIILGEPLSFITSDPNLLIAATAEGLSADDPLAHP
jgi:predicted nucleic acid-binding protein